MERVQACFTSVSFTFFPASRVSVFPEISFDTEGMLTQSAHSANSAAEDMWACLLMPLPRLKGKTRAVLHNAYTLAFGRSSVLPHKLRSRFHISYEGPSNDELVASVSCSLPQQKARANTSFVFPEGSFRSCFSSTSSMLDEGPWVMLMRRKLTLLFSFL